MNEQQVQDAQPIPLEWHIQQILDYAATGCIGNAACKVPHGSFETLIATARAAQVSP